MIEYEKGKYYLIYVLFPEASSAVTAAVIRERVADTVCENKVLYPDFRKIVVYEAETRDAVAIIKNNQ